MASCDETFIALYSTSEGEMSGGESGEVGCSAAPRLPELVVVEEDGSRRAESALFRLLPSQPKCAETRKLIDCSGHYIIK